MPLLATHTHARHVAPGLARPAPSRPSHPTQRTARLTIAAAAAGAKTTTTSAAGVFSKLTQTAAAAGEVVIVADGGPLVAGLALGFLRSGGGLRVTLGE